MDRQTDRWEDGQTDQRIDGPTDPYRGACSHLKRDFEKKKICKNGFENKVLKKGFAKKVLKKRFIKRNF